MDLSKLSDASESFVEVCVVGDAPPFVCGAHGHITADMLAKIDNDLADGAWDFSNTGEGLHLCRATWEKEQTGDFGCVEIPGHFDLAHISSRLLVDKPSEEG